MIYLVQYKYIQSAIYKILEDYLYNETDKVVLYPGSSKHLFEPTPLSVERILPVNYVGQLTTPSPLEIDELGDMRYGMVRLQEDFPGTNILTL